MRAFIVLFLMLPEFDGVHTLDQLTDNKVTFKDRIQYWQATI